MVNRNSLKLTMHVFYVKSGNFMRREEQLRLQFRLNDQPLPDKFDFQRLYAKVATLKTEAETVADGCEKIFAAFNQYPAIPFSPDYNPRYLEEVLKIKNKKSLDSQQALKEAGLAHTSMSVGDIVVVEAEFTVTVWYLDREGWTQLQISYDAVKDYIK